MIEWKQLDGYDTAYAVSDTGQVKNVTTGTVYKQLESNGYLKVSLKKNGKFCTSLVHRLVATAFIPNPHNLPQVNHKDGNKHNNNKSNLEWCTNLLNSQHAVEKGLYRTGINHQNTPLTHEKIQGIIECIIGGIPATLIAEKFGCSHTVVKQIKAGNHWANKNPIPVTAVQIRYDKILQIEQLISQGLTNHGIYKLTGLPLKQSQKIRNNEYSSFKSCYRKWWGSLGR